MKKDNRKPWERLDTETSKMYEAFKIYKDLGEKRNQSEVARVLQKSTQYVSKIAIRNDWENRALAFDRMLQKEADKKAIKEYQKMVDKHIEISLKLQDKALKALDNIKVEDMTPRDVKEILKMATDLEMINRAGRIRKIDDDSEEEFTSVGIYFPEKESE